MSAEHEPSDPPASNKPLDTPAERKWPAPQKGYSSLEGTEWTIHVPHWVRYSASSLIAAGLAMLLASLKAPDLRPVGLLVFWVGAFLLFVRITMENVG